MIDCRSTKRSGASLVELFVVVSIIGVLVGLLLPAVQVVRGSAARAACQNHLRQTATALHHFETTNGRLPSSGDPFVTSRLWWAAQILPQLGEGAIWLNALEALRTSPLPFLTPPHSGQTTVVRVYGCPSDGRTTRPRTDADGLTATYWSYGGVGGGTQFNGILQFNLGVRLADITDGTSNTLMVGERPPPDTLQAGWWYSRFRPGGVFGALYGPDGTILAESPAYPGDDCAGPFPFGPGETRNPCDRYHFWSLHRGGANFALADGSVRFFSYGSKQIITDMASRNGGEQIGIP